jgi:hypothetical protein
VSFVQCVCVRVGSLTIVCVLVVCVLVYNVFYIVSFVFIYSCMLLV